MLKFFYFSASFSSEKKEFQEKTSIRNLEKKFLIYPILGPDEDGKYRVMISGGENHGKPKICQKSIENTIKLRFQVGENRGKPNNCFDLI